MPLLINPFAFNSVELIKRESAYALVCMLAVCALAQAPTSKNPVRLYGLPIGLPLFVFALSACISTAFSINPAFSLRGDFARGESFFTIITYVLLCLIFAFFIQTFEQARVLLRALCVSSALIALYGIIEFLCLQSFGISPLQHLRPPELRQPFISATMGNANFLGRFLVLVLPLFAVGAATSAGGWRILLWAGGGIFACTTLLLTYSRASMVGLVVAVAVFIALARANGAAIRRRITLLLGTAGVMIVALVLILNALSGSGPQSFFGTIASRAASALDVYRGDGLGTRLFTWRHSIPIILERPFFGHGPDTGFDALIQVNFQKSVRFNQVAILDRIHNNYLDIALTQGLIGLCAYLAILIIFMRGMLKKIRAPDTDPDVRLVLCGLFSGFAGCIVNDIFTFSTVSVSMTFWILIGIGSAIQSFHMHHEADGHGS
jgi:putative inorganic carbon (HCO3(-)) transporter